MPYTGQVVPIPLGVDGLTGTQNQAKITANQLVEATNVTYETGAISKEGGATQYTSAPFSGAPRVMGAYDFWPTTAQRVIAVTDDGKIFKDNGAGTFGTILASGLIIDANTNVVFVEAGAESSSATRKLFIFTPQNQLKVLSGDAASVSNVATPAADWATSFPTVGVLHNNRVWAAGNSNDRHRLYYSDATNHQTFSGGTAGTLPVYSGEGEGIVALASLKGRLVVFKYPKGIYEVNSQDPTAANWQLAPLTRAHGIAGPNMFAYVADDLVFMDVSGTLHALSATQAFGDFNLRSLSNTNDEDMDVFVRANFNLARLPYGKMIFYPAKRELHIGIAKKGSTYADVRLVLDFNRPDRDRFRYSDRDICSALFVMKDSDGVDRLACGDTSGIIYKLDQASRTKDSLGYNSIFKTAHMDFSWVNSRMATMRKNFDALEVVIQPTGNWNILFDVYLDGKLTQTVSFNMGVTGGTIGSFTLGTDSLGNDQVSRRKARLVGSGTRIQLAGRNSNPGEDFNVYQAFIHFRPSDERL